MTENFETAQRIIGWFAVMVFLALAWQSMSPELDLAWPVVAGVIVLIAMLLGKINELAHLIEKWRGG